MFRQAGWTKNDGKTDLISLLPCAPFFKPSGTLLQFSTYILYFLYLPTTIMKIGGTFVFVLVILFVSSDIISSEPLVINGYNVSTKYGFPPITTTDVSNKKKTRECEEWAKNEITGQWKCVKFIVIPTK